MRPVTLTINRQEVSGHPGMTILELAQESGIEIPTLCHHAHLTPMGACRICLVENEQNGALLAACVTPIAPGMIINTESPRVLEHRKMILKLMLASHPDSCLVCDKGNRCQLRQMAANMGIGLIELDRIPQPAITEEVNPFLARDMSKCILCARCIRACQELVIEGALEYFGRGFKAKPATLHDAPLENSECTFCGTCVALCPTGALMEKEGVYRGTIGTAVSTTCPYCGCGCCISLEIMDNQVARARPGAGSAERATLCVRGSYGCDFINSPDRLTKPLIKENGSFREVSWEEALGVVAESLKQVKEKYGPDSLAVLGSANCTNEENYLLQRFARTVLGTNNIDNCSSLSNATARQAFNASLGFPGITYSMDDIEQADAIIVIGASPENSAPLVNYRIKRAVRKQGAKLVLIDPRKTRLSFFADYWLKPRVGTDLELLNSLAKVIIDENLIDQEFVARKTENYQALAGSLAGHNLETAAAVTGVDAEEIRNVARLYASAAKAAIIFGTGITRQAQGAECVQALLNLAILTGNIWRQGGGVRPLQRECNAQGACDMGALPDYLPGYRPVDEPSSREIFESRWQARLPAAPGATALEAVRRAREGKIKGMYIAGENPAASFPQSSLVKEVLAALDFLVVQDLFLTETARLANVVLPASSFAEKDGTFTNLEGKVQKIRRAVKPAGESRPDWQVILQLSKAMAAPMPFSSLEEIEEEIEELVPLYKSEWDEKSPGEESLWETRAGCRSPFKKFPTFLPVKYAPPAEAPDERFPFVLLAESDLFHAGSGTRSAKSKRLSRFASSFPVRVSEADAQKMGLHPGEQVRVVSPAGELPAVVELTDTLPEGIVSLPCSRADYPVAGLFSSLPEAENRTSSLKICQVRIERS